MKNGKRGGGGGRAAQDEMEGLFVDPEPASKRSSRAADRRRERGQAPQPAGPPDTRSSMQRNGRHEPPPEQLNDPSEVLNPKAFARATLTCTRGPEEGLSLNLIEGSYTIGRARENSFVLKDIAASRRHLRIDVDGRGARVIDLGSGNGTRLNGKRVSEQELKHGDRIEIGGSVLLFQEKGRTNAPHPSGGPQSGANGGGGDVDDAQERVIRAAEKLAAELSQRMRFGDEAQSGFEDGHQAKTQAIPGAEKEKLNAAARAAKNGQNGGGAQQKNEKLWKETFTNLPLDKVQASNQPLRGRAAEAIAMQPLDPPMPPPAVATRNPLPRPQPLPIPPPPEDDVDYSGSTSRGGVLMSVIVAAFVVVAVGGIVLVAYAFTRRDQTVANPAEEEQYEQLMIQCSDAFNRGDYFMAYKLANAALELKPESPMAQKFVKDSSARLEGKGAAGFAPPPAQPPTPVNVMPAQPQPLPPNVVPPLPAATAPPAATVNPAAPATAPPAVTPPPPPPAAAPSKAKSKRKSQPRDSGETREAREPPPPPREDDEPPPEPKSKKGKGGAMSDSTAQAKFEDAVSALREKDNKKGCRLLEEIADRAPADSRWKEKAENLFARRCDE